MAEGGAADEREARAGFTLVETLAALAVAAAIIVGAAELVHHVALYFDRGALGVTEAERFALAMDRLSRDFGAARFVAASAERDERRSEPGPSGAARKGDEKKARVIAFEGAPERIVFVSGSAVGARAAPEEALTLEVEPLRDGVTRLVRRRAVWLGPRSGLFAEAASDAVVLLEGRYEISFAFARADAFGALTWVDSWTGRTELPRLVRLRLVDPASGANLVVGAEFIVWADAPAACARDAPDCLPGKTGAPGEKKAPPPPEEPT
ncbi:prepilin-type N-terminal cleavage/methylation domain-containing protein [Methylosinus sp. KRF6]|uniref:prepilin-type N-terminal cleavage/methylation domain-containing protein n=1 Tax=Methylosinus sp. KRF6 TaxID=2846853 RepID=UPI001C0C9BE7|nr:prepilin-type N-terminal cleavage/methylation domain-containing protein [Methylosinus sp. KRF6]MBU3887023.1 prepilin-type N-terminal cleavage/methylation domain-containing protein [Methylosinus sp. KRF6]